LWDKTNKPGGKKGKGGKKRRGRRETWEGFAAGSSEGVVEVSEGG